MKLNWAYIKLFFSVVLILFLYAFSNQRNTQRNVMEPEVIFVEETPPLITIPVVNKLLIQNRDTVTSITKDALVLEEMEQKLVNHPMIEDAEVFITVNGLLKAEIKQRNPIGRVVGSPSYYLDESGTKMPLSSVYSVRVPLVTGSIEGHEKSLARLLLNLRDDEFMKQLVTAIHQKKNGEVLLTFRNNDFKANFGKIEYIQKKFQNFKAFYQKVQKDQKLNDYSLVKLQFENQVVGVKK